jgi:hypothetical protein
MSTTYHDPVANNAAATAAVLNYPLGQLDAAIASVASTSVSDLSDTTIASVADNDLLAYDTTSSKWINQSASEAGVAAASHNHAASAITSGQVALEYGGTEADLSSTGPGFLKQASGGAAVTVAAVDAGDVTYTPGTAADWDSDTDPGDLDDALDQLAERVDDLENAGGSRGISFIIDGGGAAITTGQKGHIEIPYACTITSVKVLADQSGSIVVDIWKDTYANFPPTDADSITSSAPPTLSSAQKSSDSTLTGWTKSISAGDILAYNVDSASTVERVTVALTVSV